MITKTVTTLDKVKTGTVVHLAFRGVAGVCHTGKTVRVAEPCGFNGQFYAWMAYRQGKTKLHGSTLCTVADDQGDYCF